MPQQYQFITHWQIKAPLHDVWNAIYNSLEWPLWWKGVVTAKELSSGDERGINGLREYTWKSILPYTLTFKSRLLEREDYQRLYGVAFGDLVGEGTWYFQHESGITQLRYEWNVSTTKPWMNWLSFLLNPCFRYNHDVVMRWGAKGLARRLNAELISC